MSLSQGHVKDMTGTFPIQHSEEFPSVLFPLEAIEECLGFSVFILIGHVCFSSGIHSSLKGLQLESIDYCLVLSLMFEDHHNKQ